MNKNREDEKFKNNYNDENYARARVAESPLRIANNTPKPDASNPS